MMRSIRTIALCAGFCIAGAVVEARQWVFFDFDGTIADSVQLMVDTINRVVAQAGYTTQFSKEGFRRYGVTELFKNSDIPFPAINDIRQQFNQALREQISSYKIVDGWKDVLQRLKLQEVELAVVSSNREDNIRTILASQGLLDMFAFISCEQGPWGKADLINQSCEQRAVQKQDVIYVGDELTDIESARLSGVKIVSVSWGLNDAALLATKQPDHIIHKPEELVSLLQG